MNEQQQFQYSILLKAFKRAQEIKQSSYFGRAIFAKQLQDARNSGLPDPEIPQALTWTIEKLVMTLVTDGIEVVVSNELELLKQDEQQKIELAQAEKARAENQLRALAALVTLTPGTDVVK